jgi:hypothetical protein
LIGKKEEKSEDLDIDSHVMTLVLFLGSRGREGYGD